ncbi:MAG TPA: MFS transporter [Chryseosolibacter sp.]|nr:MFS transporter [Chryseosolibacter sp.]
MINPSLYSRQFWFLCLSSLLFFSSFNMIIPELPSFLTSLGGGEYKGLIISLFTVTAMISRPFSGKLADKIGRVPVIMAGSAVCLICSLIYPLLTAVSGFLLLRLIHGFSTGFTPTGQAAYLSDIVPAERRGEAMGFLGTAGTLGMAAGPAIGGMVSNNFGLDAMFYCSSAFALISIIIVINIRETLSSKNRFHYSFLNVKRADLFEPRVLTPCLVMALSAYAYGAMFTIIPDLGEFTGIRNKGLLFTYLTVASLLVRLIGGRASDIYGRKPVLLVSTTTIFIAMMIVAFADSKLELIIGVTIYGLGQGTTSPTLLAWATDLSDINNKGRGIASLYIFMELGIGVGAFASGLIYSNDSANFTITFIVCAALAITGFLYLLTTKTHKPAT